MCLGGFAFYDYSQFVPTAWPKYQLPDGTELSGTKSEVSRQLDEWWQKYQSKAITFENQELGDARVTLSVRELGGEADLAQMSQAISYSTWWNTRIGAYKPNEAETITVDPVLNFAQDDYPKLSEFVKENQRELQPAKAYWRGGKIVREYESAGTKLDGASVAKTILSAADLSKALTLPLEVGDKHISNQDLDKIKLVMSSFTTKFSASNRPRSANIKLAAETINGLVLMPGEAFSFNDFLGKRTTAKGYKVAGVYVSGRHDIDVGGGICQVSTTLYNAAIKSILDISQRSPHSLPVPYVPLGQDAAVSYPNPNLKFTNPYDFPIAIASEYQPGQLKFYILGAETPKYEVKFEHEFLSSWSNGEKIIHDGTLAYGVKKLVDKGGAGRKVATYRLLYQDGKLVKKERLADSIYRGGPRIYAVNKKAKPAVPSQPVSDEPPTLEPDRD